jgi:hypothetical protein
MGIRLKFFPTPACEIITLHADAFLVYGGQTQPKTLYVIHNIRIQQVQIPAQIQSSLAKCLYIPLTEPLSKQMLRFRKLLVHVSRSPQYMCPTSRFPLQSLYKERDAPLPKPPLTCISETPVKMHFLQVLDTWSAHW